jgi:phosphohistidine phosphatase
MKTVLLVRHAKSSWDDISLSDFERPLNDRGKKNAPEMAERLLKKDVAIDAFLSSPAKRAKKTAEIFAKAYKHDKDKVILVPSLYEAHSENFLKAIEDAPRDAASIALFSHNPGITDFVNSLTEVRIDNMPTCSVFAVKVKVDDWRNFREATKEFYFFDFPKNKNGDD